MPITYTSNKLKSWASTYDANTILQAEKCARLPFVYDHVALMPDAHVGMGATVGSVIPTEGAIIPAAVGVDIGCGMVASLTNLTSEDLPDDLGPLMSMVEQRIPAGVGKGFEHGTYRDTARDFDKLLLGAPNTTLTEKQLGTAVCQYGTLGSGNHFAEVCLDDMGRVWTVLHSGSRGIGNQLAQIHIRLAKAQEQALEDKDLAYFLEGTPEFDAYIRDMLWAQDYAMGNRTKMAKALNDALFKAVDPHFAVGRIVDQINCHHNFTTQERFDGKLLWITRKGAIQARQGDFGVIPGSMGTRSYIVRGKGVKDAWCSCSHGAGRRMSRSQAKRELTTLSLVEAMRGRTWNGSNDLTAEGQAAAKALVDEHPLAYKDIDQVMADQDDLVSVEAVLTQVFNYKGVQ